LLREALFNLHSSISIGSTQLRKLDKNRQSIQKKSKFNNVIGITIIETVKKIWNPTIINRNEDQSLTRYLRVKCGERLKVGDAIRYKSEIGNLGNFTSEIR
jgi:hypothetical protein